MGQLGPKLALALASTLALASSSNNIVSGVVSYVAIVVVVVAAVAFVVRRQQSESANSSRTCHTSKESAPHLRERHQPRVFHCQRSYGRRNWLNCRNGKPEMCDIGRQLHTLFHTLSLPSLLLHLSPLLQLSLCGMSSAGRGNCALFAQLNATYVMHSMEPILLPLFLLPLLNLQLCVLLTPPPLPRRVCSFLINH